MKDYITLLCCLGSKKRAYLSYFTPFLHRQTNLSQIITDKNYIDKKESQQKKLSQQFTGLKKINFFFCYKR